MRLSIFRQLWIILVVLHIAFFARVLNRFRCKGLEQIPPRGGVLLASNHISAFDTIFIPLCLIGRYPFQIIWAPAKEELFANPVLSWFFRSLGAFPVRRRRDLKAAAHLSRLLQSEKVMLFPEGTRHKDGKLGEGNRGVGKLIYDNRPVVIPVRLSGINHWKVLGIGQQGMANFGAPVDFSDLLELEDNKQTHVLIVARLMSAIGALD